MSNGIVRLQVNNVKRLRAVAVKPDGALVQVAGNNAQGKSSLLDSILYALGGKRSHPPEVVRRGEKQAEVMVELANGMVVEWTCDPDGTVALVVKDKEGVKQKAPQGALDKLFAQLTFDPLDFARLGKTADGRKQQADLLRKLVGLDFTTLDAQRKETYEKRTAVGRVVDDLDAQHRGYPPIPDGTGDVEVSTAELMGRQKVALDGKAANDRRRQEAQNANRTWVTACAAKARAATRVVDAERELQAARAMLEQCGSEEAMAEDRATSLAEEAKALVDPDLVAVEKEIATVDQTNAAVRLKMKRTELAGRLRVAAKEHAALEERIHAIDAEKLVLISKAKMPVPNLGFAADGLITLNELPFEQASSAEQLRLSVAIGFAMNPQVRALLVRDGSLLDANGLKLLAELAKAQDGQVWLEVVGDREGAQVIIEDGTARGPAVDAALAEMKASETGAEAQS